MFNLIRINNVESLFASGFQVMYGASISRVRTLYVNGNDSLSASVLTTQLTVKTSNNTKNDSKVRLYFNETNSNTYYVTCSIGDECIMKCLSNTSCTSMVLTCDGVCYLNCENNCPSNVSGTWYPLTATVNATTDPSQYPTIKPSVLPTNVVSSTYTSYHTLTNNFVSNTRSRLNTSTSK